jgi:hypothetical protein
MARREFKEIRRETIQSPTKAVESLTEIVYSDGLYSAYRYEGSLKDKTPFSLEWVMPLNGRVYANFEGKLTEKQKRSVIYAIKKSLELI